MRSPDTAIAFALNGAAVTVITRPARRLVDILRDELGRIGTKIGCNAGDCGACTVLLDGRQVCACLVPAAQVAGRAVTTVEGLARDGKLNALQAAFLRHGAVQCGMCTPGMLMAATELLAACPRPSEAAVRDALGGVLCRCTGYRAIIAAVMDAAEPIPAEPAASWASVGARLPRPDGAAKLTGAARYGADVWPDQGWLDVRAIRSPHPHARFTLGDPAPLRARHPGLAAVLTARDIPGRNLFGVHPQGKDQPVLAEGVVRFRGEAVCALVGDPATLDEIDDADIPIAWTELPAVTFDTAAAPDAPCLHAHAADNVLCRGRVRRGDAATALTQAAARADIAVETSFVEHAYLEPEAGYATRVGERIEIVGGTQSPYMVRDGIAGILGIAPDAVRVIPTEVGGGFGGKLDLSFQPLVAVAAWLLRRPVRMVYGRPESLASTTKRHPARIRAEAAADADGRLCAFRFHGDYNTGAYASWGRTVADRVPIHACGPYRVPHVLCTTTALHTNDPPAGAFRGFGVPQAAIAGEALMDALAQRLGMDGLEFRLRNALRPGDATATGQVLGEGTALVACLAALRPRWAELRAAAAEFNAGGAGPRQGPRQGVGIACQWYGIGNTSLPNPSAMEIALAADGRIILFSGALDIGQGSNTVIRQIAADALGVPAAAIALVTGDTDLTLDAGKTSASRQTFVSGNAARAAAAALRGELLRLANAGPGASLALADCCVHVTHDSITTVINPATLAADSRGLVLRGLGAFDPPTTPLDADGQGTPYACYCFGAQIALVEVDPPLGTVAVRRIVAAHDVGRAINPQLVEGQIHGAIAQGLGLALMEEFIPGRTETLRDYLIPTIGDMPVIETILIEEADPLGPYGAKGVGEPALIATAPAILNAIHDAVGARVTRVPATPERVLAAMPAARA